MTSKRFTGEQKKFDAETKFSFEEAIKLCKSSASAKFDESCELVIKVGIDPKQSDQNIRTTVTLPNGSGKKVRVAAFVDSANETAAKDAGADIIGTEEYIAELIQKGVIDFDVAVAVPAMMPKLAKAARLLGPRGMMPNPKTDTVGPNITKMIEEQKGGKISFKNDSSGNIHVMFGKVSFDETKLLENLMVVLETIKKARPSGVKGVFMQSATISSTMGPGVKLDLSEL